MPCFSWDMLRDILIWAVVIVAAFMIVQLCLNLILPKLGGLAAEVAGVVLQIARIFIWAVVIILVIVFAFDAIGCLWGHMPRFGH